MKHTTETTIEIGTEVSCDDGAVGALVRVVIDPTVETLTHLVVAHRILRRGLFLVPVDLLDPTAGRLLLRCTIRDFELLEPAEERRFVQGAPGAWAYRQDQMVSWPYYGLGLGTGSRGAPHGPQGSTYDRVPKSDVEVRRGDPVHATDGDVGHVEGLVVDLADQHVTHVLLTAGHLWGTRHVSLPIGAVTDAHHGVHVSLTIREVRDLPHVEVDGLGHLDGTAPTAVAVRRREE